ncbi:phospholipase D-like domain-containing protein [Patescibacteria group bacterium]|nr:phospholipase D-like domain-containing protein [Patescibacteria group bacterium]
MNKSFKASFYLLVFAAVTFYFAFFRPPPKTSYSSAEVLGENTNLTLFIEPDDGRAPLLNYINASQNQILTEVYILSDKEIGSALASRSAITKILLEEHPFGGGNFNQKTKDWLGNIVRWTNPDFTLTHQKSMVFDDAVVCILNMNLSATAFSKNREYNICSENKEDVAEVTNIFNADWNRKDFSPADPNLVVSPVNSRAKLTAFISGAQKSLDIEMEVVSDDQMVNLLTDKAKNIPVQILVPNPKDVANSPVPGAQVKSLKKPYPHAKLIIVDGVRAYTGSVNLTTQSLDQNRELGILVSQTDILDRLNQTFAKDWNNANL